MKLKIWHAGMSDKDTADLAYWERNMLALYFADGWYNDDVMKNQDFTAPRYEGWRRVLSLCRGTITFHIPDSFDTGNLLCLTPNWDGHTTEEKWARIAEVRGVRLD